MKNKILTFAVLAAFIFVGTGCTEKSEPVSKKIEEKESAPSISSEKTSTAQLENKIVALGSSMTRASNISTEKQGENEQYSFSTGTKINSIYLYLKKQEKDLTMINLASPGAEMIDILERQLPKALAENPKYISIDPSADVVSSNRSSANFEKNLSEILEQINPATTVFIFGYPNFIEMRKADFSSCRENKIGVNLENLSEENILAFNKVIERTIAGKPNIIFVDIYNLLGPDDISDYDCLHINMSGQQKIANEFIKKLSE